jgi:predicted amidohydrolase
MNNPLSIAYIQHNIVWKDRSSNLAAYDGYLSTLRFSPDIILLPETFNTGFCIDDINIAETMDGPSVEWMKKTAAEHNSAVGGSIFLKEGNVYHNRFLWVSPVGQIEYYDKRHLFSMGKEHELFTPGNFRKIVIVNGWKICLNICYDLRFPVWSRNTLDYDMIIYIANWPKPRSNAWRDLLKARAIENMAYCIGVNRIGNDGYGHQHQGDSAFISPLGEVIYSSKNKAEIAKCELDYDFLQKTRADLPFLQDQDKFKIEY